MLLGLQVRDLIVEIASFLEGLPVQSLKGCNALYGATFALSSPEINPIRSTYRTLNLLGPVNFKAGYKMPPRFLV